MQELRHSSDLRAAGRGALGGLVAAPVFGIAHGIFLVWVMPPLILGAVIGSLGGALCGPALRRAARPITPGALGSLLAATVLPLGFIAFFVSPMLGDPAWLAYAAIAACGVAGALAGRRLHAGWRGVVALALVGLMVSGPGEPFVHEGPEPRIVGFYFGLVLALEAAGVAAALLVAPDPPRSAALAARE